MQTVIELKNINYRKKIKNLNLKISEGVFITVIGSNDSGKSDLAEYLDNNLDNKKSILITSPDEYIFIGKNLNEELKIYYDKKNDDKVDLIVKGLKLNNIKNKDLKDMNESELQLIIIAEALLIGYKTLIFDDNFINIDYYIRNNIIKFLYKYSKENNITIINITSDSEESIYSDEIAIMSEGKILDHASKKDIYMQEDIFKKANIKEPFMVEVCRKLIYYGLIDKIYLSKSKLVNAIWK